MTPDNNECYVFGDFALFPTSRVLTRFNRSINLNAKDFDILVYLIQNAGALVKEQDLITAIWGEGKSIGDGNVTNHISKIRKALNCERHSPKYIETYYGKRAYRFIAKVSQLKLEYSNAGIGSEKAGEFTIESHLIAPVFLGQQAFENIRAAEKETAWAKYKEFKIDNGRLCIMPTGIGVWHLTEQHKFSSFSDVAAWRLAIYDRILKGKHIVQLYNDELRVPLISRSTKPFGSVLGKIGYVFSVLSLQEPKWARLDTIRKPLQLLSFLGPLENSDTGDLERNLLDGTYPNLDTKEFSSPGQSMGFASWDGLSYLQRKDGDSAFKDDIIEFEVAVQAAWWLSKCLYDICLANGTKVKKEIEPSIDALKWQSARLQGIAATESASHRTMIEAVLQTSRLRRLVEDTIKLFGQL